MKAIILAAAKPAFSDLPISCVEIAGVSLLEIQAHNLAAAGISRVCVVAGYRASEVRHRSVRIVTNPDWSKVGSVGSLRAVRAELDENVDTLVLYGDTMASSDAMGPLVRSRGEIAALCLLDRAGRDRAAFREFAHVQDGRIASVTAQPDEVGLRTVFAGHLLIRASALPALRRHLDEPGVPDDAHLGALIEAMIAHGANVAPVVIETAWAEIASSEAVASIEGDPDRWSGSIPLRTDWESRSARYDRLDWVNDDVLLRTMIDAATQGRPRRALDLGTGTGKVLLALARTLGDGEFWGVDSSPAMLAKIPESHGFRLVIDDAERLGEVPSDHFDLVTARMVFHHISDTYAAARQILRVLRPGGTFVLCEGVPPSQRSVAWYTEMFRWKEDRNTLPEGDLIQIMVKGGFADIALRTVVLGRCSLNNWLDNSGIPERNIRIIKDMHFDAPADVRDDYDMRFVNGDCLMTWRFAIVVGRRPT